MKKLLRLKNIFKFLFLFLILSLFANPAESGARLSSFRLAGGDRAVEDTKSGLMWQRESGEKLNWLRAGRYCSDLGLAGYTDWRLPTRAELKSVVDTRRVSPSISPAYFPATEAAPYWTESTEPPPAMPGSRIKPVGKAQGAWYVSFYKGTDHYGIKSYKHYVRCVRGTMHII